jgi:hypothetical protein
MSIENLKIEVWATRLSNQVAQLWNQLANIPTEQLAKLSGSDLQKGNLVLTCLFEVYEISIPDRTVQKQIGGRVHPLMEGLILTYLRTGDGTPVAGKWINFRELPDGNMYHHAFQSYASNMLSKHWGNNIQGFITACRILGGQPMDYGDACFAMPLLPRILVAPLYWTGDGEFSPKASILFDANVHHYMITAGLAVLGSKLVQRLLLETL